MIIYGGFVLTLLGLGFSVWQYFRVDRNHQREIVHLKEESTVAIQQCHGRTFLLGFLGLFLFALLLVASRRTA